MAIPPAPLLQNLKDNRCILFLGSGFSTAAGYPSWPELITKLVDEAAGAYPQQADDLKRYATKEKDLLLVAEYARSRLGPQRYGSILQMLLSKPVTPQPAHKAIAHTKYRALITTNYDKLIETTITLEQHWQPNSFTPESITSLGSALFKDEFFILKLHGDIGNAGSIVLTSQDYDRLMLVSPFVRSFLQAVFLTYTVLFVGYSLNDPDFQLVRKELQLIFQGTTPTHYALLPDPHDFTSEVLMKGLNVQVIPYSTADNHKEATDFLETLRQAAPQ